MFGRRSVRLMLIAGAGLSASVLARAADLYALPWDVDMSRQASLQSNEVTRAPVKGTVPVGSERFSMTTDEADQKLTNPVAFDQSSVWRGQRMFSANCATCHGQKGDGKGPVSAWLTGAVPNLLDDFYKNRTDGRMFGTIHNGGTVMPRYGFKFSIREHWDIVNYVRFLQGRTVSGVKKP